MKEILSYRDYSYMRKRWEKYLRHRKEKNPHGQRSCRFWNNSFRRCGAPCAGTRFFRRLDAGSAAVLRLVKCSEGAGAPDSSRPWYPDGKTEDLPEYRVQNHGFGGCTDQDLMHYEGYSDSAVDGGDDPHGNE